ncbi:DHA2 family efflux MFS transporter permease subunit [Lentzea indica]|uniref:DHA2 family efflux MFS transporter permease subunit n=1 Tax=Lentzea indica TaxID=2604800 RepID=UPI0028AA9451|nr:DHA2 family efflux MFS transporter permease subunit [Lentzea indica]
MKEADRWRALAVLCVANFLVVLDTSIVNTAAPDIMASMGAGIDEVLWVLNGYLLAFAALLIVFGRLGDLVGPRTLFLGGLGLFTTASVLCGLSAGVGWLIAARVLQGLGAAMLVPQALVLIAAIFPHTRRGTAFGLFTAAAGVAAVGGPALGGLVVTSWGWQSIFYLNVPAGVAGLLFARRFLPTARTGRTHRFDVLGVLLASTGLTGIVYGLIEGGRHHWGTISGAFSIPLVFGVSAVSLVLFVLWERRVPEPLVPLDLFRHRNYTIATVITSVLSFALYGFLLVFVLETQTVLGMSPLMSGLTALPWTVVLSVLAPIAGRLADRVGGRVLLVAGLATYALGILGVAFLPTESATAVTFVLPLVVVGIGQGMTFTPATTEAMREITADRTGAASGTLNTARQVGAAMGAAVTGAVLQGQIASGSSVLEAARLSLTVVAGVVLAGCVLALFTARPHQSQEVSDGTHRTEQRPAGRDRSADVPAGDGEADRRPGQHPVALTRFPVPRRA